jgi:AcrR family transcriptional regulator
MGRNAVVTVERILAAARMLLIRFGFSKTTIHDIAKELNAGKSSLYYYFKDKDDIVKAVIDEDIRKIKESVTAKLAAIATPQEKLRTYTVIRMTFFKEYSMEYNFFKDEYLKNYSFFQKIREGYDAFEQSLIRAIMVEGVEKGIFTIKNIDLTSSTIFAAIKGMEYDWANRFDAASIEKNINALFGVLLYGIMKRKEEE